MFTAGKYKIVFRRRWHQPRLYTEIDGLCFMKDNNGRYDTVCEIWISDLEVPRFKGVAKLHPNDKLDKVLGKKIALQKAMITGYRIDIISKQKVPKYKLEFCIKSKRIEMWQAFWVWVKSWNE